MMIIKAQRICGKARRAVTLIEVIGTLSVLLAIGISATTIMSSVTKIGRRGNALVQQRQAIERFAAQFRADVHQANAVQSEAEGWPLKLQDDDVAVRYEFSAEQGALRRTQLKSNQVTSVESFEIGKERKIALQISENRVTVSIDTDPSSYPFVVEAAR
ncbi:hypothetical protein RMSM_06762 [Rhodopirellula maiorica SM1]|uniref:Prepilin-type N-terminal cleavage/methylation domain-containing protein n=1 Tax=Rhodopirellula maiorica SM1 TaxID=1265738 RepID=M5RQU9_9BACT|nr:hypothetical protein [Rhodopirellula maiorica]EMI16314.1 hypothetical protein RMSM_06762 [Rhodopirellula maiorica SM1]